MGDSSMCSAILFVNVIRAEHLPKKDMATKNDPYVQICFGECVSFSNTHDKAGSCCTFDWKAAFPFDPTNPSQKLQLLVFDEDKHSEDDLCGSAEVGFDQLVKNRDYEQRHSGKLQLIAPGVLYGQRPGGDLYVEYWWQHKSAHEPFPIPVLRMTVNVNHSLGLIRSAVDGGSFQPVDTWQIRLWDVGSLFTKEKLSHWNVNYEAAQKIYGAGVQASLVRNGIEFQHSIMYHHDKRHLGHFQRHMINSLGSLIELLPKVDKSTTPGNQVRFTYVIMPTGQMNFSITSKKTARDFLSKHALHSRASEYVAFAGEFFVDWRSDRYIASGKPALIIDNNSGTFAPAKDKLPLLKQVLERNFGSDLPILTLDRSDPALKHYFDANLID